MTNPPAAPAENAVLLAAGAMIEADQDCRVRQPS
jgi:hypothetical protein